MDGRAGRETPPYLPPLSCFAFFAVLSPDLRFPICLLFAVRVELGTKFTLLLCFSFSFNQKKENRKEGAQVEGTHTGPLAPYSYVIVFFLCSQREKRKGRQKQRWRKRETYERGKAN